MAKLKALTILHAPDVGGSGGYPTLEQVKAHLGQSTEPAENTLEQAETIETPTESTEHSEDLSQTEQVETPTQAEVRKHKLKVGGEEKEFTEEELYEHASKGLDYTRKTQELAEQRKQVEEMEQFVQYVQSQPKLAQSMSKLIDDYQNGNITEKQFDKGVDKIQQEAPKSQEMPDISSHPEFQAIKQQLEELNQFKSQQDIASQELAIQSEISEFLEEYPDLKEDEETRMKIFQHADDNGLKLRTAYRDMMFDTVASKTKEEMAKQNMRKQLSSTTPEGIPSGGKEAVAKPKTFEEAKKQILASGRKLTI